MSNFNDIDIAGLLLKKVLGTLSEEEEVRLRGWVECSDENRKVYEGFVSGRSYAERKQNFGHLSGEETLANINVKIRRRTRGKLMMRAAAVAAVVIVAVVSTVVVLHREDSREEVVPAAEGKFYAILSVDDGRKVVLKESDTGTEWQKLVREEAVKKDTEGEKVQMIRVEVPRGSEYWLRLNDSTEVWLNSETVLTYPERFAGDRREVMLRGEAFFQVKTNPAKPFEVRTDEDLMIRVTGTRLNVRNYADEQFLKVTLIKGVVQVGSDAVFKVLSPSEQAVFNRETGEVQVVVLDDPSTCVAWREGMFAFESEPIDVIFAALAQWYDVEFVVAGGKAAPGSRVTFHAMRDERVEELLEVLRSLIDFKYNVVGRKIYIHFQ